MTLPEKNWVEWLVFAISLAVISVILGFLLHDALKLNDSPARIEVFLGEPRQEGKSFVVPVVVQNSGAKAAAGIRVEVLLALDHVSERAGFDLSYSPGGSVRRGEVTFSKDPRAGILRARTPGFELP